MRAAGYGSRSNTPDGAAGWAATPRNHRSPREEEGAEASRQRSPHHVDALTTPLNETAPDHAEADSPAATPQRVCRAATPDGTRLHTREDPALSVSAGDGVFGHLMQGAPGRIRTCAHGSGGLLALG
ncbi:hypothetical protein GCM10019016_064650 [Streptomyces prasinosporus]|uniref:Uncharacterized protein n=1 Tax=Streptomyces prasinosporus TaxID=68256 RepID=A0ABP6TZ68_9ACTN